MSAFVPTSDRPLALSKKVCNVFTMPLLFPAYTTAVDVFTEVDAIEQNDTDLIT